MFQTATTRPKVTTNINKTDEDNNISSTENERKTTQEGNGCVCQNETSTLNITVNDSSICSVM